MNCQSFQNQIDEAAFTAELNRHLEACTDCKTFREERDCLSRLLTKLECVNAPANFEFGVRAKLNSLPASNGNRVWIRRFVFASPALAAVAVSAFVFTGYDVFSPPTAQPTASVASNITAPIATPLPMFSPTPQILAETNSNLSIETPVASKQNLPALNSGRQIAVRNVSTKGHNSAEPRADKELIRSSDVPEPKKSGDLALTPAATPLIQPEFRSGVTGKISPAKVLSIFGVEKISDDGTIESVSSNSTAAEKGILAGDRIETINGQKYGGNDLDNSFKQITLEVLRNGVRRSVKLEVSQPK